VKTKSRHPLIDRLYLRYLDDEDSAGFITAVSRSYAVETLERLAASGQRLTRRGAVLALGFLGEYPSSQVLARRLHDSDRVVRVLAEHGIVDLWCRDGTESQRQVLDMIIRLNNVHQFNDALSLATNLTQQMPTFAEAWNQRAIASFRLGRFEEAAEDCRQTLQLNPYHFAAAVGLAHCHLELGEGFAALDGFRHSFDLNPNLDGIKGQIEFLEQALEET
jgi:Flp pilus assembly protein TadD